MITTLHRKLDRRSSSIALYFYNEADLKKYAFRADKNCCGSVEEIILDSVSVRNRCTMIGACSLGIPLTRVGNSLSF